MEIFRVVYRNIVIEVILLISVLFQVSSGIYFLWQRKGQRHMVLEKAQAVSGLYLAYFLINHVGAVLYGRIGAGLDTNIYYGIAGFHIDPFQFYFIPYYFFAVVALFVHLASAFNWLSRTSIHHTLRTKLAYVIIFIGVSISTTLMLGFSGTFNEIVIPTEYSAIYE